MSKEVFINIGGMSIPAECLESYPILKVSHSKEDEWIVCFVSMYDDKTGHRSTAYRLKDEIIDDATARLRAVVNEGMAKYKRAVAEKKAAAETVTAAKKEAVETVTMETATIDSETAVVDRQGKKRSRSEGANVHVHSDKHPGYKPTVAFQAFLAKFCSCFNYATKTQLVALLKSIQLSVDEFPLEPDMTAMTVRVNGRYYKWMHDLSEMCAKYYNGAKEVKNGGVMLRFDDVSPLWVSADLAYHSAFLRNHVEENWVDVRRAH
jgi:hypothetical protein